MILVTGSTGQLGRLVIAQLLQTLPASRVIAGVRDPAKAADLKALGVELRVFDYNRPDTLTAALNGVERLLLISSSEVGQRATQHRNVIQAAKTAGVPLVVYTSILHADTSPLGLAREHRDTEAMLHESGLPHVLLRNGWYTENYLTQLPTALTHGVLLGCAGNGKIASASRADYAAAAATVLIEGEKHAGKTFELAGDSAYTLTELAGTISQLSGNPVVYQDLSEEEYRGKLTEAGLPEPLAELLADSDTGASRGGLFDDGRALSRLIGRETTPMVQEVEAALKS